jgi:prepilin-type N-terminal cleavage/methylation domain-containing protein
MSMSKRSLGRRCQRRGFSLLEVVLALAILVGAIAVLGELVRLGTTNASSARELTQAQLLCESKMAEIAAGLILPEAVQSVPCEYNPEFLYSIDLQPTEMPGLVALQVTVFQDLPASHRPVEFSLVRWIQDPLLELPTVVPPADGSTGGTSAPSGVSL